MGTEVINPFLPEGSCAALLGSFGINPPATFINMSGKWQALVYNRSTSQDAWLAYGPTSASVASAVVPVLSRGQNPSQNVIPIPKGTIQSFSFSGPNFVGVVVDANNVTVDFLPGDGS